MFIMGSRNLILAVDHKPLIKMFNEWELILRNYNKKKTLLYRYKVIHEPGKSNIMKVADITSKNPVREPDENDRHQMHVTKLKESLQLTGEASNTKYHTTKNALPYHKLSRLVSPRQKQNYQLNCNPTGRWKTACTLSVASHSKAKRCLLQKHFALSY